MKTLLRKRKILFLFQIISNLDALVNLEILDLSYNRIRKIEGLSALCNLRRIYLVHNKIEKIDGLDSLTKLEVLELGDNRIKVTLCLSLSNFFAWFLTLVMIMWSSSFCFFAEVRKHWPFTLSS